MRIEVEYWSGAGNTFSVIDNRKFRLSREQLSGSAKVLCGMDGGNQSTEGLLAIGETEGADFTVLFFNPDGSSGMMCGNGGRCAVRFAANNGLIGEPKKIAVFEMAGVRYSADIIEHEIKLHFPPPIELNPAISIKLSDRTIKAGYANVGSDHVVINATEEFSQDVYNLDINIIAPIIRYHSQFEPRGTNVNFFGLLPDGAIALRTFERGVEAETGACGTGAISTALVVAINKDAELPVTIYPTSGIPLRVGISGRLPDGIDSVWLQGGAEKFGSAILEII